MPVSAQPAAEDDVVSSRALRRPLPRSSSRRTRRAARRYSSLSRKRRLCRRAVHGGRPQRRTARWMNAPAGQHALAWGRPRRIGSPRHRGNLFREASHRRQNVRRRAAGPFAVGESARAARQESRVGRKRKCAQEESNPSLLVRSQTLYPIESMGAITRRDDVLSAGRRETPPLRSRSLTE